MFATGFFPIDYPFWPVRFWQVFQLETIDPQETISVSSRTKSSLVNARTKSMTVSSRTTSI